MHGRIKTRTTAEQEEIKKKERAKKLEAYKAGINAVFKKRELGEKDESVLALTAKMLSGNPDIYTLWNIRREVILHLQTERSNDEFDKLLEEELRFTEMCLRNQPKSYPSWHQRCWVLDKMTNPPWKAELALCDKYLEYDERNFHCWNYRKFITERAQVSAEEELKFTDEKIAVNFSNYSAWHLRSNLLPRVHPDPEGLKPIQEQQHKYELELVTNAAFTDPSDQSAWFYQRWLLGRQTPELRIILALASKQLICLAFNQTVSPSSASTAVKAFGSQQWESVDGEISSYVWKRVFLEGSSISEMAQQPIELLVDGKVKQTVTLTAEGDCFLYKERPEFQPDFSPGVTEVLCNVLESCQMLLQLEPDTKWPLLTSVLLMQAIDRKKYKEETLKYLDSLAKVDHLRENYYSDLKSRYMMESCLEKWDTSSDFCLTDSRLTALYHSQYLLPAQRVDLRNNLLGRSLPRLSSLQYCQILVLDENELSTLKGFPRLPSLVTLSVKRNKLQLPEDVHPYIASCTALVYVHIDGNPLTRTHEFSNGCLVEKSRIKTGDH